MSVPFVDLGDISPVELCDICHDVGFFVLVGHGVERRIVDNVFHATEAFFAQPADVRAHIDKTQSRHFRGWEPVGTERTDNRPDIREQIDLWTEHPPRARNVDPVYLRLLGPNRWPDDRGALRSVWLDWCAALAPVADRILSVLAIGLGLDADTFERRFGDERMSLTKLIHYPPTPHGGAGVNAHHDTGFVTLLSAGETPGLEVQMADGSWSGVPTVEGSFVVNLGEMLQAMTGNYLVATPHRVVTEGERFSVGYFHGPSLDAELTPLPLADSFAEAVASSPRHAGAGYMATAAAISAGVGEMAASTTARTYGEQLWNYFWRSYPSIVAAHYPSSVDSLATS